MHEEKSREARFLLGTFRLSKLKFFRWKGKTGVSCSYNVYNTYTQYTRDPHIQTHAFTVVTIDYFALINAFLPRRS